MKIVSISLILVLFCLVFISVQGQRGGRRNRNENDGNGRRRGPPSPTPSMQPSTSNIPADPSQSPFSVAVSQSASSSTNPVPLTSSRPSVSASTSAAPSNNEEIPTVASVDPLQSALPSISSPILPVNPSNAPIPSSTPSFSPVEEECSASVRESEIQAITEDLRQRIESDSTLIAQFVRASFHDCITATTNNPNSGCNGSLRLNGEITNNNNNRLANAVAHVQQVVASTCMSVADGIQLAMAVALQLSSTGGPDIISQIVDPRNPRVDASVPDRVNGELPGRNDNFDEQVQFYTRKGFTVRDLVASCAGAHSLGGIQRRGQIAPFTTDRGSVSEIYSENLVQMSTSGTNRPGFNTLNSDEALVTNADALDILRSYINPGGVTELNADFGIFLIKMSRLSGTTVGNGAVLSAGL